jgi:hypothetical protein
MSPPSYSYIGPNELTPDDPDYWLSIALGDGWSVGYRLEYHGSGAERRARILEARIVPCGRPGEFFPKRDAKVMAAMATRRGETIGPFSFAAIRRGVTARHFADSLAAVALRVTQGPAAHPVWGDPASRVEQPRRGAGRPGRPRTHYAEFAVRYEAVECDPDRVRTSTRNILARQYKKPVSTIAKWIRTARQLGFLTPVTRGQRGGRATPIAYTLSEPKHSKREKR